MPRVNIPTAIRCPSYDVYLPDGTRALVAEGQIAIAGETAFADLALSDPERTFRVG